MIIGVLIPIYFPAAAVPLALAVVVLLTVRAWRQILG